MLDYAEIGSLLEWAMKKVDTVDNGDGTETATFEVGPGRLRDLEYGYLLYASKVDACFLTSLNFEMGRNAGDVTVSADMVGAQWLETPRMTEGVVASVPQPAAPAHVRVYIASTLAGLDTAMPSQSTMKATVNLGSLRDPLWLLNGNPSHAGATETAVDGSVELLVLADQAGRGWLDTLRIGATKYVRIVVGQGRNEVEFTFAVQASDHTRDEQDAVYAVTAPLNIVRDANGFSNSIKVTTVLPQVVGA